MTVDVQVEAERLGLGGTKEIVKVTAAEVVYVAVGEDGRPTPIQP
jgi:acyl-CoA hydrolase